MAEKAGSMSAAEMANLDSMKILKAAMKRRHAMACQSAVNGGKKRNIF